MSDAKDINDVAGNSLLDRIPPPEEIRERLAACQREAAALRSLLRTSELAKKHASAPPLRAGWKAVRSGC